MILNALAGQGENRTLNLPYRRKKDSRAGLCCPM